MSKNPAPLPLHHYLREQMKMHGRALLDNPAQLMEMLRAIPVKKQDTQKIKGLYIAQREGIVKQLTTPPAGEEVPAWLEQIALNLACKCKLSDNMSKWVVKCWYFALQPPQPISPTISNKEDTGEEDTSASTPPPFGDKILELRGRRLFSCICSVAPQLNGGSRQVADAVFEQGISLPLNLPDHEKMAIAAAAFSPDHDYLALSDWQGTIKMYATRDAQRLLELQHMPRQKLNALAFSASGKFLASGGEDGIICVWDTVETTCLYRFKAHHSTLTSLALSPDGRWLAAGYRNGELGLWNLSTAWYYRIWPNWRRTALRKVQQGAIQALAFSADGKSLAAGGVDGRLQLWRRLPRGDWDLHRSKQVLIPDGPEIRALAFQKNQVLAAGVGKRVLVWQVPPEKPEKLVRRLEGHDGPLKALCFSTDGKYLLSAALDFTIRAWDLNKGKQTRIWQDFGFQTSLLSWQPNDNVVLFGTFDQAAFEKTTVLRVA